MTTRLRGRWAELLGWFGTSYRSAVRSRFARNSLWLTSLAGVERIAAVAQTVLVARALGITEYGVYGLLMGTIGLVASIVGLQMGLTATVFTARYRETDKARAALVIQYVTRFAWIVSALVALLPLPFAGRVSSWLLLSDQYGFVIVLSCLNVGVALLGGVQDGILQGFEEFRPIARVRITTALLTLAAVYPAALFHGLDGVAAVLLAGITLNFALLRRNVTRLKRVHGIPARGAGIRFADVVLRFSLPSMLISLLTGVIGWFGTYLLSRQQGGFDALAIVNAGIQWRGPILLIAGSVGSVAVPTFSRYAGQADAPAASRLRRTLLWLNCAAASGVSAVLILLSTPLLSLYGPEFMAGRLVFSLLIASTVPQVLANVYMQHLLGRGLLWQALLLHGPVLTLSLLGYVVLVPRYSEFGFALTMLGSAASFWLFLYLVVRSNYGGLREG